MSIQSGSIDLIWYINIIIEMISFNDFLWRPMDAPCNNCITFYKTRIVCVCIVVYVRMCVYEMQWNPTIQWLRVKI